MTPTAGTDTVEVPREMIEEILGNLPGDVVVDLGGITYGEVSEWTCETVPLTLPQVGELFRLAWADAADGFDTSEIREGADALHYALDCRDSAADRLRNLLLWAAGHVDPLYTIGSSSLFDADKDGRDCVVLRCKGGLRLRYATLERVAGSKVLGTQAHWVLRRLDWLLPQEGRDPSFVPAVTEAELREVCDVLARLNIEIRRGTG